MDRFSNVIVSLNSILADSENGIPEVIVLDPAGHKTSVPVKMRQIDENRWRCEYASNLTGLHSVNVFFGGIPVKGSPFGVKIAPSKEFHINLLYIQIIITENCFSL